MAMYENQHYVQKGILNNFATNENNKNKINIIDVCRFSVEKRNTDSIMKEKNIYDFSRDDSKIVEQKLNFTLEQPMMRIIEKINSSINDNNNIIITRKELELIKKYLLIQIYRNLRNKEGYVKPPEGLKELSDYNINENETKLDFWRKEILTILENEWDYLIDSTEFVGIKNYSQMIYHSFLMFVRTDDEFIINDLGVVNERIPVVINPNDYEEYVNNAEKFGIENFGVSGFGESARKEIENNSSYIDNFCFMPFSPKIACLAVNSLWKEKYLGIFPNINLISPILEKHLTLPKVQYIDINKINSDTEKIISDQNIHYYFANQQAIATNKSLDDIYEYKVQLIDKEDTICMNLLMMNETYKYLCFRSKENMKEQIKKYNQLQNGGTKNMKISFNGFVGLIDSMKEE